jgi:hypothetical protein
MRTVNAINHAFVVIAIFEEDGCESDPQRLF